MLNILVVDDHPAVTEGTKLILEKDGEFAVTIETQIERLLHRVQTEQYAVMLFDLFMPSINGIDLAAQVLEVQPDAVILIYTGFDISPHMNRLISTGISGYVSKTSTREQLVNAIRCAIRKEVVLPIEVFRTLSQQTGRDGHISSVADASGKMAKPVLQERDLEMLNQIAMGKGNRQIAEQMCVSQRSLEYSLTHIFQKLGVKSRIEAVSKAKDLGLLR
ncbi:DNA-binding response regulator [Paenibacillus sp. CAA11]|uniref:response regulator transcription factor n=1 Tax=Paenibacillus sp. CAA11 TaxID=1532905 RepID=UPI000D3C8873|nr:response regulator transcription factor [Paenibacillus sp. CAA11]AWB46035.1 DNA-binding response regulator [Paenibacillus sp. CAA11]